MRKSGFARIGLALALTAGLALPAAPAFAENWHHDGHGDHHDWHGGGYHGGGYHGGGYYGGGNDAGAIIGGALLGLGVGAAIGSMAAPPPAYAYAPPPTVYYPPAPPAYYAPPPVVYGY